MRAEHIVLLHDISREREKTYLCGSWMIALSMKINIVWPSGTGGSAQSASKELNPALRVSHETVFNRLKLFFFYFFVLFLLLFVTFNLETIFFLYFFCIRNNGYGIMRICLSACCNLYCCTYFSMLSMRLKSIPWNDRTSVNKHLW